MKCLLRYWRSWCAYSWVLWLGVSRGKCLMGWSHDDSGGIVGCWGLDYMKQQLYWPV